MRKQFLIAAIATATFLGMTEVQAQGQWVTSGTPNTSNEFTGGSVGIGFTNTSTAPASLLHLQSSTGAYETFDFTGGTTAYGIQGINFNNLGASGTNFSIYQNYYPTDGNGLHMASTVSGTNEFGVHLYGNSLLIGASTDFSKAIQVAYSNSGFPYGALLSVPSLTVGSTNMPPSGYKSQFNGSTYFTSGSSVGIGISSFPSGNILGVSGGTYLNGNVTIPGTNTLTVGGTSTLTGAVAINQTSVPAAPTNLPSGFKFGVAGNSNFNGIVTIGNTSASTNPLTIPANSTYNGTTGYSLYVSGGILTEKAKVALQSSTSWADFVFDKNYKLRSLNEVEKYIAQNHHLPEIPSAEEVKKEGLDVAEMDAKLLQKIEELTLYLIEIKKENEAIKQNNATIQKENQQLKERVNKLEIK